MQKEKSGRLQMCLQDMTTCSSVSVIFVSSVCVCVCGISYRLCWSPRLQKSSVSSLTADVMFGINRHLNWVLMNTKSWYVVIIWFIYFFIKGLHQSMQQHFILFHIKVLICIYKSAKKRGKKRDLMKTSRVHKTSSTWWLFLFSINSCGIWSSAITKWGLLSRTFVNCQTKIDNG